jgi:chorismate mutase
MDIINQNIERPRIIAGPCSAESQEQLLETARGIGSNASVFRAGVWKPRTRPNSFEGVGPDALEWLQVVKQETGLKIATEVANASHVEHCLKAGIDVLWIGARTTVNPFYVQEIAEALKGADVEVMVKNPLHPELSLWLGALERINQVGIQKLSAIHRGFFTLEQSAFRNEPMWELPIKLKRKVPNLPILCDPSHISGNPKMLHEVSQTAMDLNMDGLMIETHRNPSEAKSDAQQQIMPHELKELLNSIVLRSEVAHDPVFLSQLEGLRMKIDEVDQRLLSVVSERTNIVKKIGEFKKQNAVTILQIQRWFEILKTRQNWAGDKRLDEQMVMELFELIHKHSVLTQTHIMNRSDAK